METVDDVNLVTEDRLDGSADRASAALLFRCARRRCEIQEKEAWVHHSLQNTLCVVYKEASLSVIHEHW